MKISGSYEDDYLTLTVADGESEDSTQIELFMDCDFTEILTAISNLSNQLTNTETNLNDNQVIKQHRSYLNPDGVTEDTPTTSLFLDRVVDFSDQLFDFLIDNLTTTD